MKKKIKEQAEDRKLIDMVNPDSTVKAPLYAPNMGIHPVDYRIAPAFEALESSFTEYCRGYIEKAGPDMFNGNYMDNQIEAFVEEAICQILQQRQEHERMIRRVLTRMHTGDRVFNEKKLEKYLKERDICEQELKALKKSAYKGTCYDIEDGGER